MLFDLYQKILFVYFITDRQKILHLKKEINDIISCILQKKFTLQRKSYLQNRKYLKIELNEFVYFSSDGLFVCYRRRSG